MTKRAAKTLNATGAKTAKNARGANSASATVKTQRADGPAKTADGQFRAKDLLYPREGWKVRMPTTLSQVCMDGISDEERKRLVTAIRREYQRQYYQKHKEKAKEYQRQYNLTHKKKARGGRGKASFDCPREKVRMTFNTSDLMHSPVEKTVKMLEKIINGERMFTM